MVVTSYVVRPSAIIINDGKVLLVKSEYHGDTFYVLPGGKLKVGETMGDCLIREIKEETNLDITLKKFLYLRDYISDKEHVVDIYFLAEISGSSDATNKFDTSTSGVIKALEWVPLEELKDKTFFPKLFKTKLLEDAKKNLKMLENT